MGEKKDFTISWKTCVRLGITVGILALVAYFWGALAHVLELLLGGAFAIIAGLVIAYIINIPLRFFERKLPGPKGDGTRNRTLAVVLSYACVIVVLLFLVIVVLPNLVGAIIKLANAAPGFITSIEQSPVFASVVPADVVAQIQAIDWEQIVMDAAAWLGSGLSSSLPEIMSSVGRIGACFMGVILSFWFVGEKDGLSAGAHTLVKTYIGKQADELFSHALAVADKCFKGYFTGSAFDGVLFGTIVTLAAAIAGLPDPLMLGALIGVMSLIPMIGAIAGAVLGAIIIMAQSWQQALIFFVLFLVVQQVEQNFIYPNVVGKQVGLTGMWPLVGTTIGVALFGFIGAFIGVPLTATIFRFVEEDLARREQLGGDAPSPVEKLQRSLSK